ncbi:MAG: ribonuclease III [Sphaerochaeta sp.]
MESNLRDTAPALSKKRERELVDFITKSNIPIKDLALLNLAFTHRSFANESYEPVGNNERLEFLGDSVLGVCVADWLLRNLPKKEEGDFSRIKSAVVSEESLALVALSLGIDRYLLLGKGEESSGGRKKKAILADCMEALFGSCYLDSGFDEAYRFVMLQMEGQIRRVLEEDWALDYKTRLQEYMQKHYKDVPTYTLVRKTGPEHNHTFYMQVDVAGQIFGPAAGPNKKEAQQQAAKLAYDVLIRAK